MECTARTVVSVVIPCYFSEATIAKVVHQTRDELVKKFFDYEFILVNDGSTDRTFREIETLCREDHKVVGIDFAKNSGQHSAIIAGLNYASGDLIMVMDDDLQTHPSQCLKLIEAMDGGYDVVFACYPEHKEAWWRRLGSLFTVWSMRVLTQRPKGIVASSFFVMRKYIAEEIIRYRGPYVYIQGLIFRSTWNIGNVEVRHFERESGRSGYTFKTLLRLWSTVLGFSLLPLRLCSAIGMLMGGGGIVGAIFLVVQRLLNEDMQLGWSSLMVAVLICSGAIMVFMGLIGEYLGRLFMTINNAPQYVKKTLIDERVHEGAGE
ncbi:glycosyltransferase family 2 protein [Gordonibacter pamelaeae]|uniref:Glycosyltransferase n=1 Tax=Gordonibacter pamelaeae TaxID=471189 RepID=A0A369M527_9ACTN|nr:glycosyltransferase family 2 protein [Gordonibacter pamelaeae]RDB65518.1 glycosyltransferase [Gordonibacter pamelaeae]